MSLDVLDELTGAVSAASALDVCGLSGVEVVAAVERLEVARRRLEVASQRLVAELDARHAAGEFGATGTADLLTRRLHVDPRQARHRVALARELQPQMTITGEVVAPLFPLVASACADADISVDHAQVISRAMDRLPHRLDSHAVDVVEAALVDAARHTHPAEVARFAGLLLARLDSDGPEPPEPDAGRRDRAFGLRRHPDGTSTAYGTLNVEATALITTALDALSAPVPAIDGTPDPRTATQRRHDALTELTRHALTATDLPATGMPVTVLARTTLREWTSGCGVTVTDRGTPWPIPDLQASGAVATPVLTNHHGAVLAIADPRGAVASQPGDARWAQLWLGRARRLATRAQRLALAARDGGCSFPHCDRPPAWTQAHHVITWADGGTTDIDNLTLLCRHHHRTFETTGWQVHMTHGIPEWIPPPWIDPHQHPIHNQTQHRHHIATDLARRLAPEPVP